MARKKQPEPEENHERWLVSYADFITLLFAFFVVMYSVSSVNEGKYRVLSESINSAFSPGAGSLSPLSLSTSRNPSDGMRNTIGKPAPIMTRPMIFPMQPMTEEEASEEQRLAEAGEEMEALGGEISKMMSRYIEEDLVNIRRDKLWLEVEINTKLLFGSGSARPAATATPVLQQLAGYFSLVPNRIQVEGYTDNQPISTPVFPSNWELSSARAAAVVRLLVQYGVQPQRLASVGYAEFRPIAENDSAEGRSRNRRVVIKLMADVKTDDDNGLRSLQALEARFSGL